MSIKLSLVLNTYTKIYNNIYCHIEHIADEPDDTFENI